MVFQGGRGGGVWLSFSSYVIFPCLFETGNRNAQLQHGLYDTTKPWEDSSLILESQSLADCPLYQNPFCLPLFSQDLVLQGAAFWPEAREAFSWQKVHLKSPGSMGTGFVYTSVCRHWSDQQLIRTSPYPLLHLSINKASLPEKLCHISKTKELPFSVLCPKLYIWIYPSSLSSQGLS